MTNPSSLTTTRLAPSTVTRPSLIIPCLGSNSSGIEIATSSKTSSTSHMCGTEDGAAAEGAAASAASMTEAAEGRHCFLCFFLPAPVRLEGAAASGAFEAYERTMMAKWGTEAVAVGSAARSEAGR